MKFPLPKGYQLPAAKAGETIVIPVTFKIGDACLYPVELDGEPLPEDMEDDGGETEIEVNVGGEPAESESEGMGGPSEASEGEPEMGGKGHMDFMAAIEQALKSKK